MDGNMRTRDKLNQLKRCTYKSLSQTNLSTSSLLDCFWLVGFTDADGCFYIQTVKKSTEIRVHFKFSLKERTILDQIKQKFGSSVYQRKHPNNKYTYYWSSTSFVNALKVVKYFNRFSLQSSKLYSFLKWRKALYYIQTKRYLTFKGYQRILQLKNQMNK